MSEEEKKAIEYINEQKRTGILDINKIIKSYYILLNLIEKQQKEIEELLEGE